ncbi:MAG: metalloregulator ArsR/SmtB family transcription factor [Candidatus Eremiobacterota bacterium]
MKIRNYTNILKILSEPSRLKLIKILGHRELCVCEIEEVTGLKQPTISQQIKRLKEVDLVKERNEGKWSYYSLNKKLLKDLLTSLDVFIDTNPEELEEFKTEIERLYGLSENIRIRKCKDKEVDGWVVRVES